MNSYLDATGELCGADREQLSGCMPIGCGASTFGK
jgi:hypothetical protein